MKKIFAYLLWLSPICAVAQFHYTIDQSIPVEVNGKQLNMPWAGGLNSAQFNTLDVNGDNQQDIVVYDKGVGKIWTFIRQQNSYRYAPEFESLFPTGISSFILLRDYNCDGKKDLFTFNSQINGISVYQNITEAGGKVSWKQLEFFTGNGKTEILLTKGFSSLINILPGFDDIPSISDIDGDGDLDIVNMRFVNPSTAEYHKNFSKERYGTCDSLVFERQTQRWGDWEECSCGVFAFAKTCAQVTGGREEHTGGKALLILDTDNDGKKDILFSEEQCTRIYLLRNNGTTEVPVVNTSTTFPPSNPVSFTTFPAPFLEDVDFDGVPDLITSPNLNARVYFNTDFSQSVLFYKNTGSAQSPNFTFVKSNFLQEEMIDVGDNSIPAFADYDGDGDQDMFIGTFTSSKDFTGRILQYENTGSATAPSFKFITDDLGGISILKLYNIKPHFADADGDGNIDLVFTATLLSTGVTSLYYVPNKSTNEKMSLAFNEYVTLNFKPASTENVLLTDINKDGVTDLLIGKSTGALQYYENTAQAGAFNFVLKNASYLNLGTSTSRQNLSMSIADLDADGYQDLITGDQRGVLTVYNNFRSTDPIPLGSDDLFFDKNTNEYGSRNLGGRIWPVAVNLFNTDKPAIITGNTTGGLSVLKGDESNELPPEPVIVIYPNPLTVGDALSIKADRNVSLQVFSMLGQKMSEPLFIPAHQTYSLPIQNVATGIYIARFVVNGKSYSQKFVVH